MFSLLFLETYVSLKMTLKETFKVKDRFKLQFKLLQLCLWGFFALKAYSFPVVCIEGGVFAAISSYKERMSRSAMEILAACS